VEKSWKDGKKRIGCFVLKLHAPAHEPGQGTFAAGANHPILAGSLALDQVKEVDRRSWRHAAYSMGIASRKHDQIPRGQGYGFGLALRQETAPSTLHDVEHSSVIGDTDAPRRPELGPEVYAAAKTHTSQYGGK
jgi:hypothetical protein